MLPYLINLVLAAAIVGMGVLGGRAWLSALGIAGGAVSAAGIWFAVGVRYEIDDFELRIVHGPFVTRIPLECIEGALPTRRQIHFPPTTVETLTVVYQRDGRPRAVLISPRVPGEFLRTLAASAPFLEMRGGRAVKRPSLAL